MRNLRDMRSFVLGFISLLFILGLSSAGASSANISHSYHAAKTITSGSLVSLDPSQTGYVQPASTNNGTRLLGVAVNSSDSLLAVDATAGDVQVATSGITNTLVSTLNGPISVGDRIAVSPFEGIGMKSVAGSYIIGLAQTDFSSQSQGATSRQITDKSGKTTDVSVGLVRLNIAIGVDNSSGGLSSLNSLQKIAKSLTGHTISTVRIVISIIIALIALVALVTLIYASIYGSIISIGRNPLAKFAIFRTLSMVLAMAALVALVSSGTIYLLLN